MTAHRGTEKTHDARDGSLTMSEIDRRNRAFFDQMATTTRCGLDGCSWSHDGSAQAGRVAFLEHRRQSHPEAARPMRRPRARKEKEAEARAAGQARAAEIAARHVQRESASPASAAAAWDADRIIDAIRAFVAEHGRLPVQNDWAGPTTDVQPNRGVVVNRFGTWGDAIVAAGFPRPTRGRSRPPVTSLPPLGDTDAPAPASVSPSGAAEPAGEEPPPVGTARMAASQRQQQPGDAGGELPSAAPPDPDLRTAAAALVTAARGFVDALEHALTDPAGPFPILVRSQEQP